MSDDELPDFLKQAGYPEKFDDLNDEQKQWIFSVGEKKSGVEADGAESVELLAIQVDENDGSSVA